MRAFPYVCPHCGANQFVTFGKGYAIEAGYKELELPGLPETDGKKELCIGHSLRASLCSRCFEPSMEIDIVLKEKDPTGRTPAGGIRVGFGSTIKTYYKGRIYPEAVIPIVHASVPQPLAEDYKEGWSILDRSPKSSAVLARRCVQGAIRDFCGISKDTLNQEIDELEQRYENGSLGALAPYVSHDLIEAIDNVRKVGNIGAHMEKDVNKVIPIAHDEAKLLLDLVSTLFTEWYQAKSEREARLQKLVGIAAEKAAAKRSALPGAPP
jgi:hypothetical protein